MERKDHPDHQQQDRTHRDEVLESRGLSRDDVWTERAIREGIEAAELEEREVDDRTTRYLALRLSEGQGAALAALAATGEIGEGLSRELADVLQGEVSAEVRLWVDWLGTYWLNRLDRGPVNGWLSRSDAIDQLEQQYIEQQQEYTWPGGSSRGRYQ